MASTINAQVTPPPDRRWSLLGVCVDDRLIVLVWAAGPASAQVLPALPADEDGVGGQPGGTHQIPEGTARPVSRTKFVPRFGSLRSNAQAPTPSAALLLLDIHLSTSPLPPAVLARHGDSRHHQLPPNHPDAAVRGAHGGHQRGPRDRRQLPAVSGALAAALFRRYVTQADALSQHDAAVLFAFRVIIHIVSRCHEEGQEHYLRSFVKVTSQPPARWRRSQIHIRGGWPAVRICFFFSLSSPSVRVRDQRPRVGKLGDHPRGAGHGRDRHPQAHGRFQHQQ